MPSSSSSTISPYGSGLGHRKRGRLATIFLRNGRGARKSPAALRTVNIATQKVPRPLWLTPSGKPGSSAPNGSVVPAFGPRSQCRLRRNRYVSHTTTKLSSLASATPLAK